MQVLLLENVRFHKQEEKNDPEFAKQVSMKSMDVPPQRSLNCNASAPQVAVLNSFCFVGRWTVTLAAALQSAFGLPLHTSNFTPSMFCSLDLCFP